jgi:transcriptional regulatory protein LEU3
MAFHFFAHPTNPGPDADGLSRFFSLCVSVIQAAATMQTTQKTYLPSVSQSFIDRTITLAGFSILRLIRSPLAQHLDILAGEQAYHQAIQFLKHVSLQRGDIHYRTAYIMSDLWGSEKVFRSRDGRVEPLYLRLRTRLSMSVSYDMFWYWREEFNKMQNPYDGEEATLLSNNVAQQNTPRKFALVFLVDP